MIVNILWTGGYDSTFRVLELSRLDINIQPYYLSHKRRSEEQELNAIREITKDIEMHPDTKCKILPIIIYDVEKIKKDQKITDAYKKIQKNNKLGSQYEWLARFSQHSKITGLELGLEKAKSSIARNSINNYGRLILHKEKHITLNYYTIDEEKSSNEIVTLFRGFHFPQNLYNSTKKQMFIKARKMGLEETIKKSWFCHSPINDMPCGFCNPCKSVVSEGMEFRLPKESLNRYKYRFFYKIKDKIQRKLFRV